MRKVLYVRRNSSDEGLIPSRGIGVREKNILAAPSLGVGGATTGRINKFVDRKNVAKKDSHWP